MKPIIKILKSNSEIMLTFSTVSQLRPHLFKEDYIEKVKRLQDKYGYTLAAVIEDDEVKAVAGYRITESLAWGNYLYLDDLITNEASRRNGYAQMIWEWLINQAQINNCEQFHLDSGVQRHDAHRFYLKGGLDISSHHFHMSFIK